MSEKDGSNTESKESGQQKKKEVLLELIALGSIEKKISKRIAKKKKEKEDPLAGAGTAVAE